MPGVPSAPSKMSNQSCLILESHWRTEAVDGFMAAACASGWLAIPCKLNPTVSSLVASIQKISQNLNIVTNQHGVDNCKGGTSNLSKLSFANCKQICVFPEPP